MSCCLAHRETETHHRVTPGVGIYREEKALVRMALVARETLAKIRVEAAHEGNLLGNPCSARRLAESCKDANRMESLAETPPAEGESQMGRAAYSLGHQGIQE